MSTQTAHESMLHGKIRWSSMRRTFQTLTLVVVIGYLSSGFFRNCATHNHNVVLRVFVYTPRYETANKLRIKSLVTHNNNTVFSSQHFYVPRHKFLWWICMFSILHSHWNHKGCRETLHMPSSTSNCSLRHPVEIKRKQRLPYMVIFDLFHILCFMLSYITVIHIWYGCVKQSPSMYIIMPKEMKWKINSYAKVPISAAFDISYNINLFLAI